MPGTIPSLRTTDTVERHRKRTSLVRVLKYDSYAFLAVLLAIKILSVLVQNLPASSKSNYKSSLIYFNFIIHVPGSFPGYCSNDGTT